MCRCEADRRLGMGRVSLRHNHHLGSTSTSNRCSLQTHWKRRFSFSHHLIRFETFVLFLFIWTSLFLSLRPENFYFTISFSVNFKFWVRKVHSCQFMATMKCILMKASRYYWSIFSYKRDCIDDSKTPPRSFKALGLKLTLVSKRTWDIFVRYFSYEIFIKCVYSQNKYLITKDNLFFMLAVFKQLFSCFCARVL